jgi:DNA-binding NarL/FixJ family response regulator
MPRIRIVLADDHQAMLAKLRSDLGEEFEVVAVASNGEEALQAVVAFDPDVLVTDISMPVLNGLQTAERLLLNKSRAKVVVLSIHDDADFFDAAFRAGASAYVTKSRLVKDLSVAIRKVVSGHTFVSPH